MERIARLRWWFVGGAFGVLAALLLTPTTGWIVRSHTRYVADPFTLPVELTDLGVRDFPLYRQPPSATDPRLPEVRRAAAAQPGNYNVQLAAALMDAAGRPDGWLPEGVRDITPDMPVHERSLRALEHRIGSSPALCADILRCASLRPILVGRTETELLYDMEPSAWSRSRRKADPGRVLAFIETATTGERLDPDNAFFPMMLALGLLAERTDSEAEEALKRAADRPVWNDYAMGEALGKWRIAELAHGESGSLVRTAQAAAILLPQYAQMREMYRVMAYRAVKTERAGRTDEGIALRRALLRVSSLMRSDATSGIGTFVAVACGQITVMRHGGAPPERQAPESEEAADARARRQFEKYAAYLRRANSPDEAAWVLREAAASAEARAIVTRGVSEAAWIKGIVEASIYTAASASQAATILWILLCTAGAWVASRTSRVRSGQPMTMAARFGVGLGLAVLAFATGALLDSTWRGWALGLGALLVASGGTAWALRDRSMGRFASGIVAGGCVGVFALLAVVLIRPWLALTVGLITVTGNLTSDVAAPGLPGAAVLVGLLPLTVVPATALVMAVVSLVKRVPISVGVVRGFAGLGVPIACLLMLPYAAIVSVQGRIEAREIARIKAQVAHEGRHLAAQQGVRWPAPVVE